MLTSDSKLSEFITTFSQRGRFSETSVTNLIEDTSEETVLRILAQFNETLKQADVSIAELKFKNDAQSFWKLCHKIAGTADLLGFEYLGSLSRELSVIIHANPDMKSFENDITDLQNEIKGILELVAKTIPRITEFLT